MSIKKLLASSLLLLSTAACAVPIQESVIPTPYMETCEKTEILLAALDATGMKKLFVAGHTSGTFIALYANYSRDISTFVRVNKEVSCIVGHGNSIIKEFPKGLQKL